MKYFLGFVLLCLGHFASGQSKITSLIMERTSCFGKCPAYQVEIKSNGDVFYLGIKDAEFDGSIKGKLSMAEFAKLKNKYMKYEFLKLPSQYKVKASDLSKVHLTMTVNGKTKSIRNANEGPQYLIDLAEDIQTLVGKKIVWNKKSFVKNKTSIPTVRHPEWETIDPPQTAGEVVDPPQEPEVYTVVEVMPQFPGGNEAMMQFIRDNLVYPEMAKEVGVQGKVICNFTVGKDGEVYDVNVLRGIGYGCDQEAIRVIKMMPKWIPGKQNGRPVNVKFNLPISFKLL
jgi:TonB family protein